MLSRTKNRLSRDELFHLTMTHFPEANDVKFTELQGGMFNSVYLAESARLPKGGVVLKIGPNPEADLLTYEKEIMSTELRAYQLLANRPIPTPNVIACDFSRQKTRFDYFFMERVEGRAWNKAARGLPSAARKKLLEQLGQCNAAVHSICGEWFGYLKDDERFRYDSWGSAFCAMMGDALADTRTHGFQIPFEAIKGTLAKNLPLLNKISEPKLVDFDMWAGNVFIDRIGQDYEISGVIDFERCFYGDTFADFTSAAFLFTNVENEPEFCEGYRTISGKPLTVSDDDRTRMNLYRLYMAVILIAESYRYNYAYACWIRTLCTNQINQLLKTLNR